MLWDSSGTNKTNPDGILDLEFSKVLAQGSGSLHGIDSSAAMIEAAQELCRDTKNITFEGPLTHPPTKLY